MVITITADTTPLTIPTLAGQTYDSNDPRSGASIRVERVDPTGTTNGGHPSAWVVDAHTGKRGRWVRLASLHTDGTIRSSGYRITSTTYVNVHDDRGLRVGQVYGPTWDCAWRARMVTSDPRVYAPLRDEFTTPEGAEKALRHLHDTHRGHL